MKKEIKLKDKMSDESRIVVVKQQLQKKNVKKVYLSAFCHPCLKLQESVMKMGSIDAAALSSAYPDLTNDERKLLADIRRSDSIEDRLKILLSKVQVSSNIYIIHTYVKNVCFI